MKTVALCGIAIVCASAAFAQTPSSSEPQTAANTPRMITMTGCVAGGSATQPITLANAMVVPAAQQAATTPSPVPGATSSGTTQPAGAAAGVGAPGTAAAGVGTPGTAAAGVGSAAGASPATGAAGTPGATGTSGTAGTAGTTGVAGTAAAPPAATRPAGAPTSAAVAGTAPAGSSGSSISGYRLTGTDMSSWVGRRVQIAGSVVPAAPSAAASSATPGGPTVSLPEFRVVSVQSVTGDCPQR